MNRPLRPTAVRAKILARGVLLLLALAALPILGGCASFNSDMSETPARSGPPPYPGDPEANGDPLKAWYN